MGWVFKRYQPWVEFWPFRALCCEPVNYFISTLAGSGVTYGKLTQIVELLSQMVRKSGATLRSILES